MVTKKPPPTIFWDFDNTLVQGPGWSPVLVKVLDTNYPGHGITREDLRAFLHESYPWHNPEIPHPELSDPSVWWSYIRSLLARAFQEVGYDSEESLRMAGQAREIIISPEGHTPFDDVLPVLERLSSRGWRHMVLSNSYPELPGIVKKLPFNGYIHDCISSAIVGYEKPNPAIFEYALSKAEYPDRVWMVGDNLMADVRGAEAVGIPAILVRSTTDEKVKYRASDLYKAASIIENNP